MKDLYADIDHLTDGLTSGGHGKVATRVIDMVAAGATGTEILMGVRYVLSQFAQEQPSLSPELRVEMDDVLARINQALKV